MSNNFDPSKLNIDFSNTEEDTSSALEQKANFLSPEDIKKSEEEKLREEKIQEEFNQKKLEEEEKIKKEEHLKNVSTILIDPEIRPEELKEQDKKNITKENNDEEKEIIFDINIKNLEDLVKIINEKKYDFLVATPNSEYIKIEFKKDSVIKESLNIRYKEYTNIFIKAKNIAKLNIEDTNSEQKGEGILETGYKQLTLLVKTIPDNNGEKLYIKIKTEEKRKLKKENKQISASKAFTYLGVLLFIALVIGGIFLIFLVSNAKTVDDVIFFSSMGINLNDVNSFMLKLVGFIFAILLFIEVIFLSVNIFKAMLTKKEFKQRKTTKILLSIFFGILTFSTASAWMYLDETIRSFPNWQEMSYGDVQMYDNSILISEKFNKGSALLENTKNLIGPITIKFDLGYSIKKIERKGFKVDKYKWKVDDTYIEKLSPELIYTFDKAKNYELSLVLIDKNGEEQVFEGLTKTVNVGYVVKVEEKKLSNGGKTVQFDASKLRQLGDIEWFFEEDLEKPVFVGEYFKPSKIFFEDTLVGMHIKREGISSNSMDKIFIIKSNTGDGLKGEIEAIQDIDNDLKFTFSIKDPETDFGNGFVETFKWIIGDRTIKKEADVTKLEESSLIEFSFDEYGDKELKVQLIDSSGKIKEIKKTLKIPKRLKLKSQLGIYENNVEIEDYTFDKHTSEYFIYNIGTPTKIRFNAKKVKPDSFLYKLSEVTWDIDNDGDIDKKGTNVTFDLPIETDYVIGVTYKFIHRRDKDIIVEKKETINIEGIKKEAILDMIIKKDSDYVPIVVSFDSSKSQVKDKNIVKFIYDYGDGTAPEERDALNLGHKYITAGDYNVKLTVVTEDGNQYIMNKRLILKPKPESAHISVSMKKGYVGSSIDFSSAESEGQIKSYLWKFGDDEISTKANPSHKFDKAGKYNVNLELEFDNMNVMTDKIEIIID